MAGEQGQLVLAQNQYAFVQDSTNGAVRVSAGPNTQSLSGQDKPVIYDRGEFIQASLDKAICQNPLVPEGHYLVLENPVTDEKGNLRHPKSGINSPTELNIGRKIVIPGPFSSSLWPGQVAQVISGHHLRSNQYLVIRVYNADEAIKNAPEYLQRAAATKVVKGELETKGYTPGQLLVIKGTEVSFFIPPTGFEVLKENESYVREALTLERLEYCILLDEDGNKRFEKGPQVVFPKATERFITKKEDGGDRDKKLKAVELNDQMGIYIKVIADYTEEDGTARKTGEELFITGKEQRIYYPRAEHAFIEYTDPKGGFSRQRYYGITIPTGEGRYVLDKTAGDIKKVQGPQIFLPDPRNQVIVRRVLDERTVSLWYPNNTEAANFNRSLRTLAEDSSSYLADSVVASAAADISRSMNRGNASSKMLLGGAVSYGEMGGDSLKRGTKFTQPPMLTLSTKYDGIPSIHVYTGYAVQVVDKSGNRRVVVGDSTLLLEYDETLTVLELSSGKPKGSNPVRSDVYLRVDNNLISDVVSIETKDSVSMDLALSYRVNFLPEHKDKWFSIENYVKYLCDHLRSLLKASFKKHSLQKVNEEAASLIRDVILGVKNGESETKRHRFFPENGMDVYDVEVLNVKITELGIATMTAVAKTKAVESAISLASDEQNLTNARRKADIDKEIAELQTKVSLAKLALDSEITKANEAAVLAVVEAQIYKTKLELDAQVDEQEQRDAIHGSEVDRLKLKSEYEMNLEKERAEMYIKKIEAVSPNLIVALNNLADSTMLTELSTALAPLAIADRDGIGNVLERVFKNTPMADVLSNVKSRGRTASV